MQVGMVDRPAIRRRWEAVGSKLDERGRRMFAAGEALVAGWGGLEAVSEITGLARSTIGRGKKELDAAPLPTGRGGRPWCWARGPDPGRGSPGRDRAGDARRSGAPDVVGVEKPRKARGRVA